MEQDLLNVALAQISPIWLDRKKTTEKVIDAIVDASNQGSELITFGETFLPGYPFWVTRTNGASFNDPIQKELHSLYLDQCVVIERGDLDGVCAIAKEKKIAVVLGIAERPLDRGGHSIYCSLVYIDKQGVIQSVHRKLMPTFEERLTWAPGDGNGLRVHPLGKFTVGGLNCWENWMPLARTSLYAQGEDLHVAIWPGGFSNTHDITSFIAKEARSYVISVSGLMRPEDFPKDTPHLEKILAHKEDFMANGGSCIANPDGTWLIEPQVEEEKIIIATIDHSKVREERQNFDPVGHYSRPDVTQLQLNRERQSCIDISE